MQKSQPAVALKATRHDPLPQAMISSPIRNHRRHNDITILTRFGFGTYCLQDYSNCDINFIAYKNIFSEVSESISFTRTHQSLFFMRCKTIWARMGVYCCCRFRVRVRMQLHSVCTNYVDTRRNQHVRVAKESDLFDVFEIDLNHVPQWLRQFKIWLRRRALRS